MKVVKNMKSVKKNQNKRSKFDNLFVYYPYFPKHMQDLRVPRFDLEVYLYCSKNGTSFHEVSILIRTSSLLGVFFYIIFYVPKLKDRCLNKVPLKFHTTGTDVCRCSFFVILLFLKFPLINFATISYFINSVTQMLARLFFRKN